MVRNLQKIIRRSPMIVLEALIHVFGGLIAFSALYLFSGLAQVSPTIHDAFTKQSSTLAAFECLLATTVLLLAFSYVFCRCVKEVQK